MAQHNDLGKLGEQAAVKYLLTNQYEIIETNWRFKKAEIDIIACKNNILCCVEVKTRTSTIIANPEDSVSAKKRKLLFEAINQYISINNLDNEIRFDIITVILELNTLKINHIENAFYHF